MTGLTKFERRLNRFALEKLDGDRAAALKQPEPKPPQPEPEPTRAERAMYRPLEWRKCFVCGSHDLCRHREPELVVMRPEWRNRGAA